MNAEGKSRGKALFGKKETPDTDSGVAREATLELMDSDDNSTKEMLEQSNENELRIEVERFVLLITTLGRTELDAYQRLLTKKTWNGRSTRYKRNETCVKPDTKNEAVVEESHMKFCQT